MTPRAKFLKMMESPLQAGEGTLTGSEVLEEFDTWDSLAIMVTLALLDKDFGVKIPATKIYDCRTLDDLATLAGISAES